MSSLSARPARGVLDTCVVIDLNSIDEERLPLSSNVSTITLAELAMGVHLAKNREARTQRITRLIAEEANFAPLPFDENAVHAYGTLVASVVAIGRNPKPRKNDLMIAATALVYKVPLYTRNPDDFKGLESQLTVISV
jgi:predicted nucleic acid-binding protein